MTNLRLRWGRQVSFIGVRCVVVLRFKRTGRTNSASFRLAAFDKRTSRDGRCIEELGFYLPTTKDPAKQVSFNKDRIEYWLGVGARCSPTVGRLLRKSGIAVSDAQTEAKA
jgi:small subunit ribosomal protein S16